MLFDAIERPDDCIYLIWDPASNCPINYGSWKVHIETVLDRQIGPLSSMICNISHYPNQEYELGLLPGNPAGQRPAFISFPADYDASASAQVKAHNKLVDARTVEQTRFDYELKVRHQNKSEIISVYDFLIGSLDSETKRMFHQRYSDHPIKGSEKCKPMQLWRDLLAFANMDTSSALPVRVRSVLDKITGVLTDSSNILTIKEEVSIIDHLLCSIIQVVAELGDPSSPAFNTAATYIWFSRLDKATHGEFIQATRLAIDKDHSDFPVDSRALAIAMTDFERSIHESGGSMLERVTVANATAIVNAAKARDHGKNIKTGPYQQKIKSHSSPTTDGKLVGYAATKSARLVKPIIRQIFANKKTTGRNPFGSDKNDWIKLSESKLTCTNEVCKGTSGQNVHMTADCKAYRSEFSNGGKRERTDNDDKGEKKSKKKRESGKSKRDGKVKPTAARNNLVKVANSSYFDSPSAPPGVESDPNNISGLGEKDDEDDSDGDHSGGGR